MKRTLQRGAALGLAAGLTLGPVASAAAQDGGGLDPFARTPTEARIVQERLDPTRWRVSVPLAELRPEVGPMRLNGASAEAEVAVPVSPLVDVEEATLRLWHASSRGLVDDLPHLRLSQNGLFVAQLPARQGPSAVAAEIDLDPLDFVPGFNALSFEAVQRYTYECQDPLAPELWTEIDTLRSGLDVVYERRPFDRRLSELDEILSPGIGGVDELAVVTGEAVGEDQLRWGALAVQAVGRRLGFRLPEIRHEIARAPADPATAAGGTPADGLDPALLGASDAILIGTTEELAPYLSPEVAAIEDAYLEIGPSPADPTRFVILATGPDAAAVDRAVTALGLMSFPFADVTHATIEAVDLPAGFTPAMRPPVEPSTEYRFSDFGFRDTTVRGSDVHHVGFTFDAPADLFHEEDAEAVFGLDFAYGAGLRPDSVVNLEINGTFYRAIRLDEGSGGLFPDYRLAVPARAFGPGENRVDFEVAMAPSETGSCEMRSDRNLVFALEDTSTLAFPPAERFVRLPDFGLMGRTGFPYIQPGNDDFAVRLADRSSETLAAAWTTLARLAQINGSLLINADYGFDRPIGDRHALVFGASSEISPGLRASAELTLGPPHRVPQAAFARDRGAPVAQPGWLARQVNRLGLDGLGLGLGVDEARASTDRDAGPGATATRIVQLSDLGRNGLLVGYESPEAENRQVTLVTSADPAMLLANVRALVRPGHWSQIDGSAVVLRAPTRSVASQATEAGFHVGDLGRAERLSYFGSAYPVVWIAGILLALLAFSLLIAMTVRYLRRRTVGAEAE